MISDKRKRTALLFLACGVVISGLLFWRYRATPGEKPNIVLITLDALRPDHLGCYGYSRNTSPNIDLLAREGVVFEPVIAQGPDTLSSVPSFLTSRYPFVHRRVVGRTHVLYFDPDIISFPRVLRHNGYHTAFINNHPYSIRRMKGITRGFDSYMELEDLYPARATDRALEWIDDHKNESFFLWLYYMAPHGPYHPSLPYSDEFYREGLFKTGERRPIIDLGLPGESGNFGGIPTYVVENNIDDVDYYRAKYDGKIRVADDQVGRLVAELKRLGLYRKTIVIIMSDHGEGLGEHEDYFVHGLTLYDTALKVPMIIRDPRRLKNHPPADRQLRLLDLMPTIMEMAGIRGYSRQMEGKSMWESVPEESVRSYSYAFSNVEDGLLSVRTREWKLIHVGREAINASQGFRSKVGDYYKNDYELYDLIKDPGEAHNLLNDPVLAAPQQAIFLELKKVLDGFERDKRSYRRLPSSSAAAPDLSREMKERLKSIGYAQ
ncbi:MAG: sulfatase [Candidatus Omnitrophota bacterium]